MQTVLSHTVGAGWRGWFQCLTELPPSCPDTFMFFFSTEATVILRRAHPRLRLLLS